LNYPRLRFLLYLVVAIAILTISCASGQSEPLDKNPSVVSFEKLQYPALALTAKIQGLVVVQTKLDDSGQVIDATALSGHKMLVSAAVDNPKKWRFSQNGQNTAIVVYDFRIHDPCDHYVSFVLKGSNHAIIRADLVLLK